MKAIKFSLVTFLLLLTALWLLADSLMPEPFTYFSFRGVFVQYSGVIAIGVMSIAMILALRLNWLEPFFGGLDKMYRLHKWLGITALVAAVMHWWFAKGTKWMVGWGWLEKPARKGSGGGGAETLGTIEAFFRNQRGLAETVGEWAFYICAALLILALIKRFPYRWFAKTHTWMAAIYLVLAYHTVILTKMDYWSQPIGWLLAVLVAAGSISAVLVLAGRVGVQRKVQGQVEALNYYPELQTLETTVKLNAGWQGHQAGQFAFVTSDKKEGAHPYTIASAWNADEQRLVFITKALGDHTRRLPDELAIGTPVIVEGPYGRFNFDDQQAQQIWIGAGIGITPFIARLKELAAKSDVKAIDLFHTTRDVDQSALDKLTADAKAAGIKLHILVSGKDGRLDGKEIRSKVADWKTSSIWFCGPSEFGKALRTDFISHGIPASRFHQELFQLR